MKSSLDIFKTGWPQFDWKEYRDRKLNKETVMRSDSDNVNERLYNGRKRYKLQNG